MIRQTGLSVAGTSVNTKVRVCGGCTVPAAGSRSNPQFGVSRTHTYVAVALNPLTGPLWWEWQAHRKSTERARWGARAEEPGLDGWVWDGAGGHKSGDVQAIAAPQEVQPPYAPELNPVARFFRELRRALGDRVHSTLEAKQAALEPIPRAWQVDPARVRQLCGWGWLRDALTALADDTQVTQS